MASSRPGQALLCQRADRDLPSELDVGGAIPGGWFAKGCLGPHPRRGHGDEDTTALQALGDLTRESPGPAIRILLCHHPAFEPTGGGTHATNGADLAESAPGIHLVLAGHTHRLDPAEITADVGDGIGQLVSESPTQADAKLIAQARRSLSVYRIRLDEVTDTLSVDRIRYINDIGGHCEPAVELDVLSDIVFTR